MRDLGAQQLVDGDAVGQEQREHHRGHEQHADQRHAADQFDVKRRRASGSPATSSAGRAPAGSPSGNPNARPKVARISVSGRPPQRSCETNGEAEHAAPHQHADCRPAPPPDKDQLAPPQKRRVAEHEQRDEDARSQAPAAIAGRRERAEQDEAVFVGDDRPAGAEPARGAAGAGIASGHLPDRVDDSPVDKRDQRFRQHRREHQGGQA